MENDTLVIATLWLILFFLFFKHNQPPGENFIDHFMKMILIYTVDFLVFVFGLMFRLGKIILRLIQRRLKEHAIDVRTKNTASTSRTQLVRVENVAASSTLPEKVTVFVLEVPDGDGARVVDVKTNDTLNIRLIGIDAPEMKGRQPFAVAAKRHLEKLVFRKNVFLTKYGTDQYGRVLGDLEVPGMSDSVSLKMLEAGLADIYTGIGAEYGGKRVQFQQALLRAKTGKKGFWVMDNVTSPGKFKKIQMELKQYKHQVYYGSDQRGRSIYLDELCRCTLFLGLLIWAFIKRDEIREFFRVLFSETSGESN